MEVTGTAAVMAVGARIVTRPAVKVAATSAVQVVRGAGMMRHDVRQWKGHGQKLW